MKLLIVGAGEYGRLVKEIAELSGYDCIDFLDDNSDIAVGGTEQIEKIEENYEGSIVAIGNPEFQEIIYRRLRKPITLIHPTAVISKSAKVNPGCVIEANAVINSEAIVGCGVFVCAGAVVNHNARVGDFCQIDCNAVVSVGAEVPKMMKVNSCTVYNNR